MVFFDVIKLKKKKNPNVKEVLWRRDYTGLTDKIVSWRKDWNGLEK